MTLGERIKYLRKQNGLSQEQLADKLSVSRQAVQKWESDINEPSLDTIRCIACYFDVDLDYLLNGKSCPKSIPEIDKLIDEKELEPDKKRETIKNILKFILLCLSILMLLLCFIWAVTHPLTTAYFGKGFHNWYIPFYTSSMDVLVFQFLNILSIVGIGISLFLLLKRKEK